MRIAWALCATIAVATAAVAAPSGEDHPLLPRYAGAELREYRAPALDRVTLPIARIDDVNTVRAVQTVEGQVTHIDHAVRPATPTLAIARHYAAALERGGYRTVFDCTGEAACGKHMGELIFLSDGVAPSGFADGLFGNRMRVIVARRGDDWAMLHLYEGPDRSTIYQVTVDRN